MLSCPGRVGIVKSEVQYCKGDKGGREEAREGPGGSNGGRGVRGFGNVLFLLCSYATSGRPSDYSDEEAASCQRVSMNAESNSELVLAVVGIHYARCHRQPATAEVVCRVVGVKFYLCVYHHLVRQRIQKLLLVCSGVTPFNLIWQLIQPNCVTEVQTLGV